jgi:hypothetical protein
LEYDKKQPSFVEGRVRSPELAERQRTVDVRARLLQLLRDAVRKSDDESR